MLDPPRDRSQSGLDRVLLFVVLAIALVIVTPHVLEFAGVDVRGSTASEDAATPDHDLAILAARGGAVDAGHSSIGVVRLVVSPNPGREPVDLREGTAIWIGDRTFDLVPVGAEGDAEGQFQVEAVDGDSPVLETPTDRGVVRFDLGTDDVPGVAEFGERLEAGETATVVLVTSHGETLTRRVTVPEEIPVATDEVWL